MRGVLCRTGSEGFLTGVVYSGGRLCTPGIKTPSRAGAGGRSEWRDRARRPAAECASASAGGLRETLHGLFTNLCSTLIFQSKLHFFGSWENIFKTRENIEKRFNPKCPGKLSRNPKEPRVCPQPSVEARPFPWHQAACSAFLLARQKRG